MSTSQNILKHFEVYHYIYVFKYILRIRAQFMYSSTVSVFKYNVCVQLCSITFIVLNRGAEKTWIKMKYTNYFSAYIILLKKSVVIILQKQFNHS